ncbi:chitobiase/beta-hexosaminidase C-terminal domain-containing protein [Pseudobacteroides cellulosolvens]|uniref:Glycoside hydrolase family 20 domain protein n=1 Tax=Pseudobacteroides cellulosolvens ATCC 35603 = DSM 2933 TaxID=398512 RepID=A0A0L6JLB7_9FIRM|nr:chitobiase/beta-hexosaminidase C-terminal domain-containing protein [Pseudobacteroides cellulosolvens]KNY26177.1 glycoside hydrolase family 20 domain protein [Pseudobacteroides cellulosolvens ATCC 35603 = DSM 2933]
MKISKKAFVLFLIFSILLLSFQSTFAQVSKREKEADKQVTGLKQPSEEDKRWMNEHEIKVKGVLPNKIALERTNEIRLEKGLEKLDLNMAAPIGEEVIAEGLPVNIGAVSTAASFSITQTNQLSLLTAVDNSELKYFPPIRNQGSTQSCGVFAQTYYQATHMNAMARDWNVKADTNDSKKFSPQWSYNLLNGGSDSGTSSPYKVYFEQGIALWGDFPFDEDYTKWPTDPNTWKNARNFIPDKMGSVEVGDGTDTPVQNQNDDTLNNIKQLLNNGYVLTFCSTINDWNYKPIKGASDSSIIGRAACYMEDDHCGEFGGHFMTIVGYDDSIWVDINNNGKSEPDEGEKGAFKIANSWGDKWEPQMDDGSYSGRGDGFVWLCYDAINKVSAVNDGPKGVNVRNPALRSADWITFKPSYTASLMAEINFTHLKRNQLRYELGYSEIYESSPTKTLKPSIINQNSEEYSFSGSIMLDYTKFFYGNDLVLTPKKWYIKITDIDPDGIKATINSFNLFDPNTGALVKYSDTAMNLTVNDTPGSNSVTLCIQYKPGTSELPGYQWNIKNGINTNLGVSYIGGGVVNFNGRLYAIANNNNGTSGKDGALLEYNPLTEQWSVFRYMPKSFGRSEQSVVCNGKLYIFSGEAAYVCSMVKNSSDWDIVMLPDSGPDNLYSVIAPGNGKIYIIGGDISGKSLNTIFEYSAQSNNWTEAPVAYLQQPVSAAVSASIEGKIYIMGGRTNGSDVETVEMYNPADTTTKTTQVLSALPDSILMFDDYKIISLNNKIYLLASKLWINYVYEFNPYGNTWEQKEDVPEYVEAFNAEAANGKVYVFPKDCNGVLEFNPVPVIPKPVFSPTGGTYNSIQTVSINCITNGATIRYTTDGTTPTSTSAVYTGPITVAGTKTIKAYASKTGMTDSYVSSASYTLALRVGDVNGDGFINSNDFELLRSHLQNSKIKFPVDDPIWVADLDGNGYINSIDLAYMNQYLQGKRTFFPKEMSL